MNISIVAVGKLKEDYFIKACGEYEKRLSRFCSLKVTETADEKAPESLSSALEEQVKDKEGKRLLSKIGPKDYVVALTLGGKAPDSPGLARFLQQLMEQGKSPVFLIGGSLGLSKEVLDRADEKLSLSNLTFPHRIARLVLLEQLFRSFKILSGEAYHK